MTIHTTYTEARANLARLWESVTADRETVIISWRGAPAAGRDGALEQALDEVGASGVADVGDVDELGSDEGEAPGSLPGYDVAGVDTLGPGRQTPVRQLGQPRREVKPVRLDPVAVGPG